MKKEHPILHVTANPIRSIPLQFSEETAGIERELRMAVCREAFPFVVRSAISIDDLARHLTETNPSVIHISAHSRGDSLLLQDEHGQPQEVPARPLAMMVEAAAPNARIAVLSFCRSAGHAEALRRIVDCVVYMDGVISDVAAIAFARRFYSAIGNRRSVGNAVQLGVAALAAHGSPDEALVRCVTRDRVDPNRLVLARGTGGRRSSGAVL